MGRMWNQPAGMFDLGAPSNITTCVCTERRAVLKLFFTDCYVAVKGLENFVGGKKVPFQWQGDTTGSGKTLMFPTDGVYIDLKVATRPGLLPIVAALKVPLGAASDASISRAL